MVTFGVQVEPQFGYSYGEIRDIGRACEELGFETLTVSDHFMLREDAEGVDSLECWSILAALAVDLEEVRIGPLVSCTSYRHPALLAKVAATVDVLSQGRLEFGIGAGWKKLEYDAYGYPFPPFRERVERMAEAIEILRRMWGEGPATFEGRHYAVHGALCDPKPLQRPGPPLWVGGGSDPVLRVAAHLADGVNIPFRPPEAFGERVERIRAFCQEEGRDVPRISTFPWTLVAEEGDLEELVGEFAAALRVPQERVRRIGEDGFLGPPEALVGRLQGYVDAGAAHLILGLAKGWERRSMELIHDRVMGALR